MTAPEATWVLSADGRSVELLAAGSRLPVTYLDIWDCEFDGKSRVAGHSVGSPSSDLPDLTFSAAFYDSVLDVESVAGGALRLVRVGPSGEYLYDSMLLDQVVSGTTWYPIDVTYEQQRSQELAEVGGTIGAPLSVSSLLGVLARPELRSVIDPAMAQANLALSSGLDKPESPHVNAELYSYQQGGVRYLRRLADEGLGGILGDEMGLGKTLQIIALLASEVANGRGDNLVVCPPTLLRNWQMELEKFAPHLRVLIHAGPSRAGILRSIQGWDVVVTGFETAVRDCLLLSGINWNVLAVDEAQGIKNAESRRAQSVKSLPRRVSIAVTGTPVENRLSDLWSLIDFALPGYLGDLTSFRATFENELEGAEDLAWRVAPLVIRRLVRDVANELPEKIVVDIPIRMGTAEAEGYEELRAQFSATAEPGAKLALVTKLRRYCSLPFDETSGNDHTSSEKLHLLAELIKEIETSGGKALIFSNFLHASDVIVKMARESTNALVGTIDGRLPIPDRQTLVDEFNSHTGPAFLVINPQAGGTGLNLQGANHVVHFSLVWNPAVEDQATARAHRGGQLRPVTVHRLYYEGTVEEVILERLQMKRELGQTALADAEDQGDEADLSLALTRSPLALDGTWT